MTLNGAMTVFLSYFSDFGSSVPIRPTSKWLNTVSDQNVAQIIHFSTMTCGGISVRETEQECQRGTPQSRTTKLRDNLETV